EYIEANTSSEDANDEVDDPLMQTIRILTDMYGEHVILLNSYSSLFDDIKRK
ncbi:hypothetical protein HY967_04200, partial [Candidatus Jorgensenbacteria bacterium]|nr:hypothetical protein [Candidatus Jorgensenbacteria bacterium]